MRSGPGKNRERTSARPLHINFFPHMISEPGTGYIQCRTHVCATFPAPSLFHTASSVAYYILKSLTRDSPKATIDQRGYVPYFLEFLLLETRTVLQRLVTCIADGWVVQRAWCWGTRKKSRAVHAMLLKRLRSPWTVLIVLFFFSHSPSKCLCCSRQPCWNPGEMVGCAFKRSYWLKSYIQQPL